jgi:Ca-activated chloride channel homolog
MKMKRLTSKFDKVLWKPVITLGFLVWMLPGFTQGERKLIREGNEAYKKGRYKDAEIDYRKALTKNPRSDHAIYNLGTSLYKQKNNEEAVKALQGVNTAELDKASRAKVFHNLGNSLLQSKKYPESIQAYKNALKNSPNDQDTRYNLAYAMQMMQQQQQQQNKQSQDDKDNKDKNKQQQQQQQDQKQDQKQQKQQKLNKEDADRMLDALKNNEKNTLDKLKKQNMKAERVVIQKDW